MCSSRATALRLLRGLRPMGGRLDAAGGHAGSLARELRELRAHERPRPRLDVLEARPLVRDQEERP